jgi:hypothetical protein
MFNDKVDLIEEGLKAVADAPATTGGPKFAVEDEEEGAGKRQYRKTGATPKFGAFNMDDEDDEDEEEEGEGGGEPIKHVVVEGSEGSNRKYRKTGAGGLNFSQYNLDDEEDDDDVLTPAGSPTHVADKKAPAGEGAQAKFAVEEDEVKQGRTYRKTGATPKFGAFNMDDEDDDDEEEDDKEEPEAASEDSGNHVGFQISNPGDRRTSKVKVNSDLEREKAPKRQFRKTGANMVEMLKNPIGDDDDDDSDEMDMEAAHDALAKKPSPTKPAVNSEEMEEVEVIKGVKSQMRRNSAAGLTQFAIKPGVLRTGVKGGSLIRLDSLPGEKSESDKDGDGSSRESFRHKISFGNDKELLFDNTQKVNTLKSGLKKKKEAEPKVVNASFDVPQVDKKLSEKIHKRYRKTGISFASYDANEEESDGEDADGGSNIAPSQSLLNASPAWMEMKSNTEKQFRDVGQRLMEMEQGMIAVKKRMDANRPTLPGPAAVAPAPSVTVSVSSAELDSAFISGFASGGSGQKLDMWASLVILAHVGMIISTVLFLVDAFSMKTWSVVFLVFLVVTLLKLFTTFNQHKLAEKGNLKKTDVRLAVAQGDAP